MASKRHWNRTGGDKFGERLVLVMSQKHKPTDPPLHLQHANSTQTQEVDPVIASLKEREAALKKLAAELDKRFSNAT